MRIAGRLARLEARGVPSSHTCQIVIYDATTSVPLPGYEPRPDVRGCVWIPDNARGPATGEGDDPNEYRGDARCD